MTKSDFTPPSEIVLTKFCTGCKSQVFIDDFHKNKRSADGLQGLCKPCAKARRKKPDPESVKRTRSIRLKAAQSGKKPCTSCHKVKPLSSDYWVKESRGLGGFASKCKCCQRSKRLINRSPALVAKQEEVSRLKDAGMKRCPACSKIKLIDRFIKRGEGGGVYSYCLSCCRDQSNKSRLADLDADRAKKLRSYYKRKQENGKEMNARRNHRRNNRRKTDPVYAMADRIRSLIGSSFKRRGYTKRSTSSRILGCDWDEFAHHIERQFTKGMTWDNRDRWHLDHIVPMSTAKTEDEVIALNHFTNLRPMWASDNISKGDSILYLV